MLVASIVIRSESGAPFTTSILLEGGLFLFRAATTLEEDVGGNWGTISDLITIESANIWEW